MAKAFLTDEQVEAEIARLSASPMVKLAQRETRLKNVRRQRMYSLRVLEKRGQALAAAGVLDMLSDLEDLEAALPDERGGFYA